MSPQECVLMPGDILKGRNITGGYNIYKVVRPPLGEGGFGIVYLVKSNTDDRLYALKVLKLWTLDKKEQQDNYRERFNRAFQIMNTPCKYLLHTTDRGEIVGNPFYVMEYCPNGDLHGYLKKINKVNREQEVVRCMYQVLLGLKELHSKGMVHRDLKPENVMLRSDKTIALNDFDLVGDENNRLTEYNILGNAKQLFYTKAFAPPEQLNTTRGKKEVMVMPTIDIFAFAVMNYLLLVDKFPFGRIRSDSDMALYYAHVNNDEWDRAALQNTANYDFWRRLLEPCLKGNYQKRLNDVKELIVQFEERFPDICNSRMWEDKNSGNLQHDVDFHYPPMQNFGLRVLYGDKRGIPSFELLKNDKFLLTIGRHCDGVNNDIELYDDEKRYISRRHATLEWDKFDCHWYIRDGQYNNETRSWVRSKNGTYVNSREVDAVHGTRLEVDDIIYMGEMRIVVTGFDDSGWCYHNKKRHKNPSWT